jgi:hypothetical protein
VTATAAPVDGALSNQFAAVRMDATYDLRPAPVLFVVYLLPFLVLGFFWVKVLRLRRALARAPR